MKFNKNLLKYLILIISAFAVYYISHKIYEYSLLQKINAKYFQIVSPELLNQRQYAIYNDVAELFEVEKIINKQNQINCISVSLFCKNVNNTYINENPVPSTKFGSVWYDKYFKQLLTLIDDFNKSDYKKEWKFRIFLENDLSKFIPLLSLDNVEIYLMKNNSIGAGPGSSWRYLSFDDKNLESVYCSDIDETFNNLTRYLNIVNDSKYKHKSSVFIRAMPYYKNDFKITDGNGAVNVTVIMGGMVGFYPTRSKLNIKNLIIKYTCLRIERYDSKYPYLDYDSDLPPTIFNRPLPNKSLGWGGHTFVYGFDEKFLKAVLFSYFVKRGELISVFNEKDELQNIKKLDNSEINLYFKTENTFCEYYKNVYYMAI